jgi:S1-C subfamily serine protease
MRRLRVAPSMLAVIALSLGALLGCAPVLERWADRPFTTSSQETPAPEADHDVDVATARRSVVKVHAEAHTCQKLLDGTGLVVAPNRVLTVAHVVAGGDKVSVDIGGAAYDAHVVSYDSATDVAVVDVPSLPAPPLPFSNVPAAVGTEALLLGYPSGMSLVVTPVRIVDRIQLDGPDIYRTTKTSREVYIISGGRGQVVPHGVSGGPLLDMTGHVLGVAFGSETDEPSTGFALSAAQVEPYLAAIGTGDPVATGPCVS